ncbi:MAG: hypothetical protein RRB13_02120 [bacterium]|nr:hypothetical protein [bacterium]
MKSIITVVFFAFSFICGLSPAFAGEHQLGFSVGSAGGTYHEPNLDISLAGARLDLPTYEYIFDSNFVFQAQYNSWALTGTEYVVIDGWTVTAEVEYVQVAFLIGGGYRIEASKDFFITPSLLIGSSTGTTTLTASLLGNSVSNSYTASGGMSGVEIPFMWRVKDNLELGFKLGGYSSGMDILWDDGSKSEVRITGSGAYTMRWVF